MGADAESTVNGSGAFEVVRRGYARDQVDGVVGELEVRLREAENGRRMAEQHAASLAEELRLLRAGTPAEGMPAAPQSFGFRAEKVLRLADRDAAELRAAGARDAEELRIAAARDADAVLTGAHREADAVVAGAHREAENIVTHAHREAAGIRAAASREGAELLERAHGAAAAAREETLTERAALATARSELGAHRSEVERSVGELAALRASVRGELARVHAALGAELHGMTSPFPAAGPVPGPGTTPRGSASVPAPRFEPDTRPEQPGPGDERHPARARG